MFRKRIVVCILSALLVAMMLTGCGAQEQNETTNPAAAESGVAQEETSATESAETTGQDETEEPVEVLDYIPVETPYGELRYQEQWVDYMKTSQITEGDTVTVNFSAVINETEYPLFSVTIGGTGDDAIGQLTDAEGTKRDVFILVEDVEISSELTEGEQNRLYAMMEEVNYVIENIK